MDSYFVDTKKFPIDKFKNILKNKDILPGRIILKQNIDRCYDILKSKGIQSLYDLHEALKTKSKIDDFSKDSGLSADYLTILRREADSYLSVPVKLIDLQFDEIDVIKKLNSIGIKTSKQLFENAAKRPDRESLAEIHELPLDKLTELVRLCDLVRITGVGPVFARLLYDSNIHSVKQFLSIDSSDLFERLTKLNAEKKLSKAKFSIKDIEYCIELGKDLPIVVEQ